MDAPEPPLCGARRPASQPVRRALAYFRPDRSRIGLLLLLIGLNTALGLLQVWPLAILVDQVLAPAPSATWFAALLPEPLHGSRGGQILLLALAIVVLRFGHELVQTGQSLLSIAIGNRGLSRVRCALFRKLQELQLQYHRTHPQGDSLYRLVHDASACQALLDVVIGIVVAAVTLAIMLLVLASRSVPLTLVALAIAPLLLITNLFFADVLRRQCGRAKESESRFTSTVQRALGSIVLVQAFRRQADEFGRFHDSVDASLGAWFGLHRRVAAYRLCVGALFALGSAAIFGYGGWLVHQDQFAAPVPGGMTVGDLVVFLTYLGMFYDPLCKLSGAAGSIQQGLAGAERIFEVLDQPCAVEDRPDALAIEPAPRTLSLHGAGFSYPGGRAVLQGVDVTIASGELVAFVGASGAGKSTLLNLLPRFFDPTHGSVRLDGHDLRDLRLQDLRHHVGVVLQDCLVLPTTIAENIAYGRPGATPAEIRQAAEQAGAHEFIAALPDGYATVLAEGGQNLSGGQRQRIAIARALLAEATILVLDEPTSALDAQNERLVADTLVRLKGRRTVVLVSHRLSTVAECDRIFVLEHGRVVESGDHAHLLALGGRYAELAERQGLPVPRREPALAVSV